MIEWRDEGVLLSVRKHGETSVIAQLFTREHGRHAGVIRGGAGRKMGPVLQAGTQLDATWKARLDEQLGTFSVEPVRSRAALVMNDPLALSGLTSVVGLLAHCLPEREAQAELYDTSTTLLDLICTTEAWPLAYLRWEVALLSSLGFGLDLKFCAVSGTMENLEYVSPKTGRAVAAQHAGQWKTRLLPLPACMVGAGDASNSEIAEGLRTTGHFLEKWVAPSLGDRPLPVARQRFVERLLKQA